MKINGRITERIVKKAFNKAKEECHSHTQNALSKHISETLLEKISARTLIRAHKYFVNGEGKKIELQDDSVNLLCEYLGFVDYEAYKKWEKRRTFYTVLAIGAGIIIASVSIYYAIQENTKYEKEERNGGPHCMAWVEDHYERISCDLHVHSSGTRVEPYDAKRFSSMKKIEVTILTNFFSKVTRKPLVWYAKKNRKEVEFFSAPGLHPVTGKTLDEITPYIIERYVPFHMERPDSFLPLEAEEVLSK